MGGIVHFVRLGTSISPEDVAFAFHAIVLQISMVDSSCAPAWGCARSLYLTNGMVIGVVLGLIVIPWP